jgi:hypothetical protein
MRLYHGTSKTIALAALDQGLLPRAESGVESHWEECPSRDDLVYLTTAYAGYFACHATNELEHWGIVEVDTDLLPEFAEGLVPDEDWLEQSCRCAPDLPPEYEALDMQGRTAYWRERLHAYQDTGMWLQSIEGLGNCAHVGPIPPEAITRVSIFDPKSNPSMAMTAIDPIISVMNYALCQGKYQALIKWFMGDEITVPEFFGFELIAGVMPAEQVAAYETMIAKRDGIETLDGPGLKLMAG